MDLTPHNLLPSAEAHCMLQLTEASCNCNYSLSLPERVIAYPQYWAIVRLQAEAKGTFVFVKV